MSQENTDIKAVIDMLVSTVSNFATYDTLLYFKTKLNEQISSIYAAKESLPTKVSQLTNDSGFQTAENVTLALQNALTNYALKSSVPTKTSQLTNDSGFLSAVPSEYVTESELSGKGYQTSAQVESAINSKGFQTSSQVQSAITSKGYQTESQVRAIVNAAGHFTKQIVDSLPAVSSAQENVIYLVPKSSGTGYDEYQLINGAFESFGSTDADLSGYYNTTNLKPITNSQIDEMFA